MNNLYNLEKKSLALSHIMLAFAASFGITYFVLLGGWSLGFFLAVLTLELIFLAILLLPFPGDGPSVLFKRAGHPDFGSRTALLAVLAAAILDLALCFAIYDNIWLRLMNFPVICLLILGQVLTAARIPAHHWDQPGFWAETALSGIIRPFVSLPDFGHATARLFIHNTPAITGGAAGVTAPPITEGTDGAAAPNGPSAPSGQPGTSGGRILKVLLGIALAVPVLLISGTILAAADPVFADLVKKVFEPFANLSIQEIFNHILVSAILLPFIFSFLFSLRGGKRMLPPSQAGWPASQPRRFHIDKTVLIAFLSCVNLLYLVFAIVQVAYLTGAFSADLPEGMTYAEYARSGFFELSGISVVNLALVLLAVKSADRRGAAGAVLRAESVMLVVCSLVQWVSALFRMKMYIDEYGLTLLRFFVTAFMLLIALLFAFLTTKEFAPRFPLMKSFAAAMLASLLILNHVDCDAWIACHNVRFFEAGHAIDVSYYRMLSSSSVPTVLELTRSGDARVASEAADLLIRGYELHLQEDENRDWQNYNISRARARRLIESHLEELIAISPGTIDEIQR